MSVSSDILDLLFLISLYVVRGKQLSILQTITQPEVMHNVDVQNTHSPTPLMPLSESENGGEARKGTHLSVLDSLFVSCFLVKYCDVFAHVFGSYKSVVLIAGVACSQINIHIAVVQT